MAGQEMWDVAVIGAGPAGLAAAHSAATAGARTVVFERAKHPRYKTCGGGLIGASIAALHDHTIPVSDLVYTATFTREGRRAFTHHGDGRPLVAMTQRSAFDDGLRHRAENAGAVIVERTQVRALRQEADAVHIRLASGSTVSARSVVGADGSSGISARHVEACFSQVDIGLEVELPVPRAVQQEWRGRILIDWGPIPGSYGWVFPKDDTLTVGVIASRANGPAAREYLSRFLARLRMDSINPVEDSGHLTRCRTDLSPLYKGRVLLAGDAAGLLEPWSREGISFALRSGALAGASAAAVTGDPDIAAGVHAEGYAADVAAVLVPEMKAGSALLGAFARHPGAFHRAMGTTAGFRLFAKFCRGEAPFSTLLENRSIRYALAGLGRW